jgi:tripartite-type tricarboxylate transporter receptor subunit TctC
MLTKAWNEWHRTTTTNRLVAALKYRQPLLVNPRASVARVAELLSYVQSFRFRNKGKSPMRESRTQLALRILLTLALLGLSQVAPAQTYPVRPIKLLVPMPPGGASDFWARLVSGKMSEEFGQQVLVENRPGASTMIAAEAVSKAPADGYTVLLGDSATYAVNRSLFAHMPYDPGKDLSPVTLTSRHALVLAVNPSSSATTLAEFVTRARSTLLNVGTPDPGSPHHLAMELFMQRAGIKLNHIPFKGGAAPTQELIAGRLDAGFLTLADALPHIRAGKLRALGVASAKRVAPAPDIPTIAEQGYPGYEADAWQGFAVPAGTPAAVIAKINEAHAKAVADPEVRRRLLDVGIEPTPSTPQDFAAYIKSETEKWAQVVRENKITVQ